MLSPITEVPTRAAPGLMMSAVRKPVPSTLDAGAAPPDAASSSSPNEIAQQHRQAEDLRPGGWRWPRACDVGRAAVDRLVQRRATPVGAQRAKGGGGQHAEAAGQHGGEVAEQDVAEQVAGDDHVELACGLRGPAAWRSCRRSMWDERHIRHNPGRASAVTTSRHSRPLSITLALLDRCTRRCWRCRARSNADAGHALDLGGGVGPRCSRRACRTVRAASSMPRGLAEIDAAHGFAHDHDVEAAHHLRPSACWSRQAGRCTGGGPQVGEQFELAGAAGGSPSPAGSRSGILLPVAGRRRRRTAPRRRRVRQPRSPRPADRARRGHRSRRRRPGSSLHVEADAAADGRASPTTRRPASRITSGPDPVAGQNQQLLVGSTHRAPSVPRA